MAVSSSMIPLGTEAPSFALPDPTGVVHRLDDTAGAAALVVGFICNHCPYVKHIAPQLAVVGRDLSERGVAVVAISANDVGTHPQDGPDAMGVEARERGYTFPYLYDESQDVARAYGAVCTPDFFVFDGDRRLVYRGQFDDSRPGSERPVTGSDLLDAVDRVLTGSPPIEDQLPSIGCSIKWRQ